MQFPLFIQSLLEPWLMFLAEDPLLRGLQIGMLLLGAIVIFFVFYATRDIILRTHSFWYMFFSIILVAVFPIIGFFLYLLIRPARTIKDREMEGMLKKLTAKKPLAKTSAKAPAKPEPKFAAKQKSKVVKTVRVKKPKPVEEAAEDTDV